MLIKQINVCYMIELCYSEDLRMSFHDGPSQISLLMYTGQTCSLVQLVSDTVRAGQWSDFKLKFLILLFKVAHIPS